MTDTVVLRSQLPAVDWSTVGPQQEEVAKIVSRIAEALSPTAIILFGSRARGQGGPDSDVDLLVVWRDDEVPPQRSVAVRRAIGRHRLPLDIAVVTPTEFEQLGRRPAHIVGIAAREGVLVHAA